MNPIYRMNETEALINLVSLPRIGSTKARLLIQYFGSALAALEAPPQEIVQLPGFGPKIIEGWEDCLKKNTWRKSLDEALRCGIQVIDYQHPSYPKKLLETSDFPLVLYMKGTLSQTDACNLAIVGTRFSSPYGNAMAQMIARELASHGFTITSGLARGIDTHAHVGALESGRTIAVIGSGLGSIYPKENLKLANAIAEKGCLLTEYPFRTPPDRQNFPRRNRIVCGMSYGTLLIEAPEQSGAMITMEKAYEYRRRLYALPGRADCEYFRGNHRLIKEGKALLIETAQDILSDLKDIFGTKSVVSKQVQNISLESEEQIVYQQLSSQEISFDALLNHCQLSTQKLMALLMRLQLKQLICELPGKFYRKI